MAGTVSDYITDDDDEFDKDLQTALLLSNQTMGLAQEKLMQANGMTRLSWPSTSQNSMKIYTIEEVPYKDIYYKLKSMFPRCNDQIIKKLLIEPPFAAENCQDSERLNVFANLCAELNITCASDENVQELNESASLDAVYEYLKKMFPDADKTFIFDFARKNYQNNEAISKFIDNNLKNPKYLTTEKCLERDELRENYVLKFNVEKFVDAFHNPVEYFEDPKRKCPYSYPALQYLRKVYSPAFKINELHKTFTTLNNNLILTIKKMDEISEVKSYHRSRILESLLETTDVHLLTDVVYLKNKWKILKYLEKKHQQEYREIRNCIKNKSFIECECCLVDYIPSRLIYCTAEHAFCKSCVMKSVEVKMSDANFDMNCILRCGSQFRMNEIQKILKPADCRKFMLKWQEAEIRKAKIDGLVSCPFCSYSAILPDDHKSFNCMNPECQKISCRQCKKVNHAPDPCDEKVKARHMLEEEMTKALLRNCYRCKKSYIKVEGCNFIHCDCGASMCYFCEQPITSYAHFNTSGTGCKTFTDNIADNQGRVRNAAEKKANEILAKYPDLRRDTERLMQGLPTDRVVRPGFNPSY